MSVNTHPRFAGVFARLARRVESGGYVTLDCRDGVHSGCETCSCACHNVGMKGQS